LLASLRESVRAGNQRAVVAVSVVEQMIRERSGVETATRLDA